MKNKYIVFLFLVITGVSAIGGQTKTKFSFAAQKQFIPVELGQVYLGMPFHEFARKFDLSKAEVNGDYGWLEVEVPFRRGPVTDLIFKVHGLSQEEMTNLIRSEKITEKSEYGQSERDAKRLDLGRLPATGFVYEISLAFKKEFDLKNYVVKTYGLPKDVHKAGEAGYFYDMQWFKKTSDGLTWMIRSFHEGDGRTLKLIGIIDGTEWDPTR